MRFLLHLILIFIFSICSAEKPPVQVARERFDEIVRQNRFRDARISETMMELSDYQDTLLSLLYSSKDQKTFIEALHELELYDQKIRYKKGNDLTSMFNFYAGTRECITPHEVPVDSIWGREVGFLNSFKKGRNLKAEERERFFYEEESLYMQDHIFEPFILNQENLHSLESNILYNFALLDDGRVFIAPERLGEKEYNVAEGEIIQAFTHPNHTILAGSPHQVVLSAGALIVFKDKDKSLYFISSKSGHFQPTYDSLDQMRRWFSEQGVDRLSVVPMPDVDMAWHGICNYSLIEVPILVTEWNAKKMFISAYQRWQKAYQEIDLDLLKQLAEGNIELVTRQTVYTIENLREEANFMRCTYRLLSEDHSCPPEFDQFVTIFGKIKDAARHENWDVLSESASSLLDIIDAYKETLFIEPVKYTSEESFVEYFTKRIKKLRKFLEKPDLSVEKYHKVKKMSREMGQLFQMLSEKNRLEGRHYFLYRAVSTILFSINETMGEVHSEYVARELKGDKTVEEERVVVCEKTAQKLLTCINHFSIQPPHFTLDLNEEFAKKLFNRAAFEWWVSHQNIQQEIISEKWGHYEGTVKQLLRQIINKKVTIIDKEIEYSLYYLKILRYWMEDVLDLYKLLDARHEVPFEVAHYTTVLDRLIHHITYNREYLENREYEATWLLAYLSDASWPFRDPHRFESDTQEGLYLSIEKAVDQIRVLAISDELEKEEAVVILDAAKQLAVVFNLIRQDSIVDGIEEYRTMPKSCYESLAFFLEKLTKSLSLQVEKTTPVVFVKENQREIAKHIVKKLG